MASRALKKSAPSSASAAEAITFFMIFDKTNTAPLKGGVGRCRVGEEEVSSGTGSGARFGEVTGVRVEVKDHGGGVEAHLRVGVSEDVVEEAVDGSLRLRGWFGLLGSDGTEGDEGGGVDCPGVVQDGSYHLLYYCFRRFGEGGHGIWGRSKLRLGAIVRLRPVVWRVLVGWWAGCHMWREAADAFVDISGHGYVDPSFGIIPFDG